MNVLLARIFVFCIVHLTLCAAVRYECDKGNGSCGCGFDNVNLDENDDSVAEAVPYSWSMIVSIRYDCRRNGNPSTHCCAGTILNERYVLTAARCFDPADNSSLLSGSITVAAGAHNLSGSYQSIRVVSNIFAHSNWTTTNEAMHNLALLRLAEPLDLTTDDLVSSACYPFGTDAPVEMTSNTTLAVAGWSVLGNTGDRSDDALRQLAVYPIEYNDPFCSISMEDSQLVFCAGRIGAACFPEVGGPAFQWIGNRWELIGIESYAMDGCLRVGYRGLFVRVSAYHDWIESILSSEIVLETSTQSTTTEPSTTTVQRPQDTYACNRNMACGCGYSDVTFRSIRIFGGEDVVAHSWSMIVSLRFYENHDHFCAGTLLSSSYVLTAAHCVDRFSTTDPVNITIVAGVTNQSDPDVYLRRIDRIDLHPNYTNQPYFLNDIALLHMSRPLYFQQNPVLAKTCVSRGNSSTANMTQQSENDTRLVVIGWGAMRPGTYGQSEYLRQMRVSTIDDQDPFCQQSISDSELQFCAGVNNGQQDACLGDSGGPILRWTGQYWEQVGIVGQNFHCGRPGYPGIYTRLENYWRWMEEILNATNEQVEPQIPFPTSTTSTTSIRPTGTTSRRPQTTTSSTALPSPTTMILDDSTTTSSHVSLSSTTMIPGESNTTATVSSGLPPSTTTIFGESTTTTLTSTSSSISTPTEGSTMTVTISGGSPPSTTTIFGESATTTITSTSSSTTTVTSESTTTASTVTSSSSSTLTDRSTTTATVSGGSLSSTPTIFGESTTTTLTIASSPSSTFSGESTTTSTVSGGLSSSTTTIYDQSTTTATTSHVSPSSTTTESTVLSSSTTTGPDESTTTSFLMTFSSILTTASEIPTTTASNSWFSSTMTTSDVLLTTTSLNTLSSTKTTSSDSLVTMTTTSMVMPLTTTSFTAMSPSVVTTTRSSTLSPSTTTTPGVSPVITSTIDLSTSATTATGPLQTTISSSAVTATTTRSLPLPTITTTTGLPREKITYECNRIPNECGCSLANVVLSRHIRRRSLAYDISETAYPYSWSMIVSIRVNGTNHACMGTILSEFFILTTAQCVVGHRHYHSTITVAAGIHSLAQYVASTHTVAEVHVHESYTADAAHLHDIAILRLEHPLELKTQPLFSKACLPSSRSVGSTADATTVSVGWKHVMPEKTTTDALHQVQTKPLIDLGTTCFNSTFNDLYQFCVGVRMNDEDACAENFGEPIFTYHNNYWEQIGMLSRTHGCTPTGHSGVYTRLSAYTGWIQKIMKDTMIPLRRPVNVNSAARLQKDVLVSAILLLLLAKIFS